MSDEPLKIKLTVADRVYPLTVKPEQEEGLRLAAKNIDELIKRFEGNYEVKDKQDVLAMCALQFASSLEQKSIDRDFSYEQIEIKLKNWLDLLDTKV